MPIANEKRNTLDLLKDARYHRAALDVSPETETLARGLEPLEATLRERHAATDAADDARLVAHARLVHADLALDTEVRAAELELLAAVQKDRTAIPYRVAFPRGLTGVVTLRGEAQALAVRSLVAALREHAPRIADARADALVTLADRAAQTERTYIEAEEAAATAFVMERAARVALLRQMRVHEGVLTALHPEDRRRVRNYFRPIAKPPTEDRDDAIPEA